MPVKCDSPVKQVKKKGKKKPVVIVDNSSDSGSDSDDNSNVIYIRRKPKKKEKAPDNVNANTVQQPSINPFFSYYHGAHRNFQ